MKADRTPKPKVERKHVSVGMEMDLYAEVLAAAQKAERTVGAEIRLALRRHVAPSTVTIKGSMAPEASLGPVALAQAVQAAIDKGAKAQ